MKVLTGSSNVQLAQSIAEQLHAELLPIQIATFPDGEKKIQILKEIKGEIVVLVQTLSPPIDSLIIETILLLNALETNGALSIHLVIPWMGYSIQNQAFLPGEPVSAQAIASLFSSPLIRQVVLLDLHRSTTKNFFSRPTVELSAVTLFADFVSKNLKFDPSNCLITAPDLGADHLAETFSKLVHIPTCRIKKVRNRTTGEIHIDKLYGSVKNKDILLIDDGILTGKTIQKAAEYLRQEGAEKIYCFATHSVLTKDASTHLRSAKLTHLYVTNSVFHQHYPNNTTILDCATLFSQYLSTQLTK